MLCAKNITVQCNGVELIKNVTCTIIPGRITGFIGKSGAGKTTLLKTCAGLIANNTGTITIDDVELKTMSLPQRAVHTGYVFQEFNLFPHLTVLENCIDPLAVQGIDRLTARQKATSLLHELDLALFINAYPSRLSGGQQQRVAIVRALCLEPQILLFDEPTASLDPFNVDILIGIMKKLAFQGISIGFSSQDLNFIRKIMDRVYYLENGRIIEYHERSYDYEEASRIRIFLER